MSGFAHLTMRESTFLNGREYGLRVDGGSSTILCDCYADTGKIGFLVDGWDTRLLGCSYFNNSAFKLDGITIVRHKRCRLLVTDGAFVKTMPHYTVYDGCGEVE